MSVGRNQTTLNQIHPLFPLNSGQYLDLIQSPSTNLKSEGSNSSAFQRDTKGGLPCIDDRSAKARSSIEMGEINKTQD